MAKIWVSPVGKLVEGHVLDCRRGPLEVALRRYDAQLYLKWNSKKLRGEGCWELRRKPEYKSVKETLMFQGKTYAVLEYKEYDTVNHVRDFAHLNYKILEWVKDPLNDTWQESYKAKNFVNEFEYRNAKAQEKIDEQSDADRKYNIKQHKREIAGLMDYLNSGGDPNQIVENWK